VENSVLMPGQQLAVAARLLPAPRGTLGKKIIVDAPLVARQEMRAVNDFAQRAVAEKVEFELAAFSIGGSEPMLLWRFDGQLFVDHWVEADDVRKLCLFIELACKAKAVSIHGRDDELVRVNAYFGKGAGAPAS